MTLRNDRGFKKMESLEPTGTAEAAQGVDYPNETRTFGPQSWAVAGDYLLGLRKTLAYQRRPEEGDPRVWMSAEQVNLRPEGNSSDDFWFDYVADLGDSIRGTYSVAFLLHGDLTLAQNGTATVGDDSESAPGGARGHRLPRGSFLFLGGDAAYTVADGPTIATRLALPFNRAYAARFNRRGKPEPRPIFGIPGNHDWYDRLDGWNRLIRPTATGIDLKGHTRRQCASYVSITLPFDWRLDGLDLSAGNLDARQKEFFADLENRAERKDAPLIICTPEPRLVRGRWQDWVDRLATEIPFLGRNRKAQERGRVFLSGDVHHYARYDGQSQDGDLAAPSTNEVDVACGLGGGALHPIHPKQGPRTPDTTFPTETQSRRWFQRALLSPAQMLLKNRLWLIGGLSGALFGSGTAAVLGGPSMLLASAGFDSGQSKLVEALGASLSQTTSWAAPIAAALLGALAFVEYRVLGAFLRADRYAAPSQTRAKIIQSIRLLLLLALPLLAIGAAVVSPTIRVNLGVILDIATYASALGLAIALGTLAVQGHVGCQAERILLRLSGAFVAILLIWVAMIPRQVALGLAGSDALTTVLSIARVASKALANDHRYFCWVLASGITGALLSALVSPLLFGLAVSLQLRAGGAVAPAGALAGIDRCQAFIRFQLRKTKDGSHLTGYVIAVSAVTPGTAPPCLGWEATGTLVDIIHLSVTSATGPESPTNAPPSEVSNQNE